MNVRDVISFLLTGQRSGRSADIMRRGGAWAGAERACHSPPCGGTGWPHGRPSTLLPGHPGRGSRRAHDQAAPDYLSRFGAHDHGATAPASKSTMPNGALGRFRLIKPLAGKSCNSWNKSAVSPFFGFVVAMTLPAAMAQWPQFVPLSPKVLGPFAGTLGQYTVRTAEAAAATRPLANLTKPRCQRGRLPGYARWRALFGFQ